jgi:hypothetical protein
MIARGLVALSAILLVSGCGGSYSGAPASGSPGQAGSTSAAGSASTPQAFFAAQVEPNLGFCRTCHVSGGVADTPGTGAPNTQGNLFLLSSDTSQDYANLQKAWTAMGGGVDSSLLLRNPSDPSLNHNGGQPWPQTSQAYAAMKTLLGCWNDPSGCAALLGSTGGTQVAQQQPLLGSSHARTAWNEACSGQPDSTPLPQDPRSLIVPGANAGKAVFFNAYWENCHALLPAAQQPPKTCGEWRARAAVGQTALIDTFPAQGSTVSAADYNNSWQSWGLSARPDNFDQLYTLRYGLNHAPFNNPYPLPGEDPAKTNGGSGQLPLGLRQVKDASGNWTGQIGTTACFGCHGGQIGDPAAGENAIAMANLGLGNNNVDTIMQAHDNNTATGGVAAGLEELGVQQRGQNNAVAGFELLFMLLDYDTLGINPNPLKLAMNSAEPHPTAEVQDSPAWWNYGHRPRKFFDAGTSNDGTRIIMAAGAPTSAIFSASGAPYRNAIDQYDDDIAAWLLTLQSPAYPYGYCSGSNGAPAASDNPACINQPLAEQGAVLFHTLNLWSLAGNSGKPAPLGGNGSCAGCHGAYSPRYVNDPTFLATPALEGIAGHISPLGVIGTDPARANELSTYLRAAYGTTFWGFPDGQPGWVDPGSSDPLAQLQMLAADGLPPAQRVQGACGWEQEVIGYQAPPLYGVWATAPYFHNGSVPSVEAVLNSSERPQIWQRKLQTINGVTGYDQGLASAYDFQRLGWQYTPMTCDQVPGGSIANCNPAAPTGPSVTEIVQSVLDNTFNWAALLSPPGITQDQLATRLVYDSRRLGNGNGGHDFADALTDQQRKAIIEYLKTL